MSSANTTAGFFSSTGFSSQCFPVRSLTRYKRQDDEGKISWLYRDCVGQVVSILVISSGCLSYVVLIYRKNVLVIFKEITPQESIAR